MLMRLQGACNRHLAAIGNVESPSTAYYYGWYTVIVAAVAIEAQLHLICWKRFFELISTRQYHNEQKFKRQSINSIDSIKAFGIILSRINFFTFWFTWNHIGSQCKNWINSDPFPSFLSLSLSFPFQFRVK